MTLLSSTASSIATKVFNVLLANGGGTISSEARDGNGPLVVTQNRAFHEKFHSDLEREKLEVLDPIVEIFPKRINSENMTIDRLKALAEKLIEIIKNIRDKKLDTKTIIVTFGTDTMDKVVNILSRPRLKTNKHNQDYADKLDEFIERENLRELIDELNQLIDENHIRIVFTGSNTDEVEDIKRNFLGACNKVKQIENGKRDDYKPGIYIFHNSHWVPGEEATKSYARAVGAGGGKAMHYMKRTKRNVRREENKNTLVKPQKEAIKMSYDLRGLEEQHSNKALTYNVAKIRNHHNGFREMIADDNDHKVKAVLLVLYHSGTANTDKETPDASVEKLVQDIRKERDDIVFFAVNENHNEPVTLDAYGSSEDLRLAGVVPLYNMMQETAEAKLDLLTKRFNTPHELIVEMLKTFDQKACQELGRTYSWGDVNPYRSLTPDINTDLINTQYIDDLQTQYQIAV